jgi:hypothetical protein
VIGPHFQSLHHELDQVADPYRRMADEVAERMASIGSGPMDRSVRSRGIRWSRRCPAERIEDATVVREFGDPSMRRRSGRVRGRRGSVS